MTTTNVKPGGNAAEIYNVQRDVDSFAKKLVNDKASGNEAQTQADLAAFHSAYKADGGNSQASTQEIDLALQSAPGLSKNDISTLASIAGEDTEI